MKSGKADEEQERRWRMRKLNWKSDEEGQMERSDY